MLGHGIINLDFSLSLVPFQKVSVKQVFQKPSHLELESIYFSLGVWI